MKKFILLYKGPATKPEDMSEEQRNAIMAKWAEWMSKIGSAMADMGQPMTNGIAVVDNGSYGPATQLSGYSIIQAEDMEGAKALVADHPFLSEGKGNFSVEVHELLPVPKM